MSTPFDDEAPSVDTDDQPADTIDDERIVDDADDPADEAFETVTNDAAAGETVSPERGDGTAAGATGGAPSERTPDTWEHDDEAQNTDFGDDLGERPL